ncbi:hypothetical protein QWZ13_04680 [Reinekea marina]|uniref:hypothetical protein n=1 Tax=Reinekea marina TaxID=1310421 RepID=UPI0025B4883B|nr:hypothetical protein [Reinekea marina]MDN3648201.1 hypothetical protein [Reinekea marina]
MPACGKIISYCHSIVIFISGAWLQCETAFLRFNLAQPKQYKEPLNKPMVERGLKRGGSGKCEFQAASCKLQAASCKLQAASCKLQAKIVGG